MYLFETDNKKAPYESTYGSREVDKASSISGRNRKGDGHINRNLRASMALIDMAKPYIKVTQSKQTKTQIDLKFIVKGCITVDSAKVVVKSGDEVLFTKDMGKGNCNYRQYVDGKKTTRFGYRLTKSMLKKTDATKV